MTKLEAIKKRLAYLEYNHANSPDTGSPKTYIRDTKLLVKAVDAMKYSYDYLHYKPLDFIKVDVNAENLRAAIAKLDEEED